MEQRVRIWRRPKTAMQSGMANTHEWVLAHLPGPRRPDPLMGWIGGAGTETQVELKFASREEAVAYAEREGLSYDVEHPTERVIRPKSYADNFRFGRTENWTH
jgi:hypothetical protein